MISAHTWFVIRHRPSGLLLPEPAGRQGRGGSHVEPSVERPRLFSSRIAARNALSAWLRGKFIRGGSGYDSFAEEYYEDPPVIEPQPHRVKADMEIVPVEIREIAGVVNP